MRNIKVTIFTPQDLNHSSYMQTGLFELEERGEIDVEVRKDTNKRLGRIITKNGVVEQSNHPQPKTSYYLLEDFKLRKKIFFAADLYDVSHFFSEYALKNCEFIFKRNFNSEHINLLQDKFNAKLLPAGLTFGCQTKHKKKWNLFKQAYFVANARLSLKFNKNLYKKILQLISKTSEHLRYVTKGRSLEEFRNYSEGAELRVFYQVRCFPRIDDEDVQKIHQQRTELIKILKLKLGEDFFGGLVPGKVANELYPEYITNLPTDPVSYLNLIKNSAICIYTKGLQNSPARKLPEYLSQAKCIVAEKFTTELQEPLVEGEHIMYFNTPEECAEICSYLLKNPKKVKELSRNARKYYENYIDPEINVKRMINKMLTYE